MNVKNMLKGNGILMAVVIALLGGYYIVTEIRQEKVISKTPDPAAESNAGTKQEDEKSGAFIPDTGFDANYLQGRFDPAKDSRFTGIDLKYANRKGMFLREEAYGAFIRMHQAAAEDGVKLVIISATRSFNYQKGIWEAKWNGSRPVNGKNLAQTITDPLLRAKEILKYSSMPGTSRHHWGTDIDLNSVEDKYFETAEGNKLFEWLNTHASEFGFCRPYTAKGENRPTGYEEEKWHWSYLPLAKYCLNAYKQKVSYSDFTGFRGCETAEKLKVIEDYVMGVNSDCK